MADKDGMERKVYLLPTELVTRMRKYQQSENITSEVETARRLLNLALQMQENIHTILVQLSDAFARDKNVRSAANKILGEHILIKRIEYLENEVIFELMNGDKGKIAKNGDIFFEDGLGDWVEEMPF